ncbi:MAG: hypothetical protein DRI99_01265 [Candidatus Aminicenantes bacterium]|nr:MAG: hypothetical protein DRJ11_08730 [Candidatus Aminicenantes bacterium]RLE05814.1 MAG: hypothetical protein DRI99_01265 [Candidatus Aminicenantes bacterium]
MLTKYPKEFPCYSGSIKAFFKSYPIYYRFEVFLANRGIFLFFATLQFLVTVFFTIFSYTETKSYSKIFPF